MSSTSRPIGNGEKVVMREYVSPELTAWPDSHRAPHNRYYREVLTRLSRLASRAQLKARPGSILRPYPRTGKK